MLLSIGLVGSLTPALALADTTVGVKVEKPVQVNETVVVGNNAKLEGSPVQNDALIPGAQESVSLIPQQSTTTQLTAAVAIDSANKATETLLTDGLTYELNREDNTATLIGWYGDAPKGDIFIPSQVLDSENIFSVHKIGGGPYFYA